MTPHDSALKQVMLQPLPHDDVQVGTSWQVPLHPSLQTRAQAFWMLLHSWVHPSPVHPRAQSGPLAHAHGCPGSHPSVTRQFACARSTTPNAAIDAIVHG